MTDLIELRKLAWKANMNIGWIGAGPTRHGDMISTSGKPLFIDSVYLDCDEEDVGDDNGYFVCSVNEHDYGEFIAAASPKVVLELLDRIAKLEAELASEKAGHEAWEQEHLKECAKLESQLAAAEKDAARYRWLLDFGSPELWLRCSKMNSYDLVETAIDDAMKLSPGDTAEGERQ